MPQVRVEVGGTTIFFDSVSGQLGGISYGATDLGLNAVSFNAGGFTFPTNGQDFSITVPASIDVITGDYTNICPNPTCSFTLQTEPRNSDAFVYFLADGWTLQ